MTIFIVNKYTNWYYNLVKKRQDNLITEGYFEKHHIIPRSLGGSDCDDNLVCLTAREHFVAHWLLTKMVSNSDKIKMMFAFTAMSMKRKLTSLEYSKVRQAFSDSMKIAWQDPEYRAFMKEAQNRPDVKIKQSAAQRESKNRPEAKDKQSAISKRMWSDLEYKTKQSVIRKEVQNRPETKAKKSVARKKLWQDPEYKSTMKKIHDDPQFKINCSSAQKLYAEQNQMTCPHCEKTCNPLNAKRWHFDNCKMNKKKKGDKPPSISLPHGEMTRLHTRAVAERGKCQAQTGSAHEYHAAEDVPVQLHPPQLRERYP